MKLKWLMILVLLVVACRAKPEFVSYECVEYGPNEALKAADYQIKCVEAGGKGVRSTEDWVEACRKAARDTFCKKEHVLIMNQEGGFARIPCNKIGTAIGKKLCEQAGWGEK